MKSRWEFPSSAGRLGHVLRILPMPLHTEAISVQLSLRIETRTMSDVVVKARENGPFLVSGPFKLIDHLGNSWDLSGKENVALCRCGESAKRPFCDGTHRSCGFQAGETAPPPEPTT